LFMSGYSDDVIRDHGMQEGIHLIEKPFSPEDLARRIRLLLDPPSGARIVVPEQEGLETIQALRRDVPGIGIIAISGAFEGRFLKMAQMMGANAVLSKPVNAE